MRFGDAEIQSTGAFLVGELERLDPELYEPIVDFTWSRDIDLRTDVTIADEVSSFILSNYAGGFGGTGVGKKSWITGKDSTPAQVSVSQTKVMYPVTPWGMEVSYSVIELQRSMQTGRPIDVQKYDAMKVKHQLDIDMQLNQLPPEGTEVYLYADWNRDGVFESATELTGNAREFTATINVPADAKTGQSRMRFRLTDNGLTGAEDDVNGQTWDLVISTVDAVDGYTVSVSTSSEERGSVAISPAADTYESGASVTATATAKGNSEFVCWREGNDVVSLDAEYPFTVTHSTQLTAYFTPKTSDVPIGIDDATSESKALVTIDQDNSVINIVTDAVVKAVNIYSTDGALIAKTTAKRIALDQYPLGTYIVKVITDGAETQAKVLLK